MSHRSRICTSNDCSHHINRKSLQGVLSNGSRIDKLYYEKYLPWRERRLLEKLVRTREVYDDIGNRIPSGSSIDMYEGESTSGGNSSDNLHNGGCPCCLCTSKIRASKPFKVHGHIPSPEHITKYLEQNESRIQKGKSKVRYRPIQSEPCVCSYKFRRITTQPHSKLIKKADKPKQAKIDYKKTRTGSATKIKNASNRVRESIRSSVTAIENAFYIKKDSIALFREKIQKKQSMKQWACEPGYCISDECIPEECYETIKKKRTNKLKVKRRHDKPLKTNVSRSRSTITVTQASSKITVERHKYQSPKSKVQVDCKCKMQTKSTASMTDISIAKTISKGSVTKTDIMKKELPIIEEHKIKKSYRSTPNNKPVLWPPCHSEDCARLPLKRSHHRHELKHCYCTLRLKKPPKTERIRYSHPSVLKTSTTQVPGKAKLTSMSMTKPPTKDIQTRVPKHRNRTLNPKQVDAPYAAKSKSSPNAPRSQVVRIGSSFRFDIEFFKDKNSPDQKDNIVKTRNYANIHVPSIKTNLSSSETKIQRKYLDQIDKSMMYDKSVMETILKQCKCNLKLNKPAKQKKYSSKVTMTTYEMNRYIPHKSQSSMTSAFVNYVIPPQTYTTNLLPYECEPYFCTPGQCDPHVCAKRKKMRNAKTSSRSTMLTSTKSTSTLNSIATSKSAATYTERHKRPRHKYSSSSRVSDTYRYGDKSKSPPSLPSSPSSRQAVRIGSSFKFNVEFYKNKSGPQSNLQNPRAPLKAKEHHQRRDAHHRGQGTQSERRYNNNVRARRVGENWPQRNERSKSQISREAKSKLTVTEPFLKRCFCTLKFHKNPHRRKVKQVMTSDLDHYNAPREDRTTFTQTRKLPGWLLPYECEPNFCTPEKCNPNVCEERIQKRNGFLKRCFCTLKFHRSGAGKRKSGAAIPLQNISRGTETVEIKQPRNRYQLLAYECEPGVCSPGHCDPYECIKLINKHNTRDGMYRTRHINTKKPRRRSVFSRTSRNFTKSQKSQSSLEQARRRKYADQSTYINDPQHNETRPHYGAPKTMPPQRQAVKVSSAINFNIEFYKNKSSPDAIEYGYHNNVAEGRRKIKQKDNHAQGFRMSKDRGVRTGREHRSRLSQSESPDRIDRSSITESKLERCFCTLKLHKPGHQQQYYRQRYQARHVLYINNTSPFFQDLHTTVPP